MKTPSQGTPHSRIRLFGLCIAMLAASFCGCSTSPVENQPEAGTQSPERIVRQLCGTDAYPRSFAEPSQVNAIRGLLAGDIYEKLFQRAGLIARVVPNLTALNLNETMIFRSMEWENPFVSQLGLSPKAAVTESISGKTATVTVRDDYYGQDLVIGVLRLNFSFRRYGPQWRLVDETITSEDTRPNYRNTNERRIVQALANDVNTLRNMARKKLPEGKVDAGSLM